MGESVFASAYNLEANDSLSKSKSSVSRQTPDESTIISETVLNETSIWPKIWHRIKNAITLQHFAHLMSNIQDEISFVACMGDLELHARNKANSKKEEKAAQNSRQQWISEFLGSIL